MAVTLIANAQYYYNPHQNGANPRNLNNDAEYPSGGGLPAGWTTIQNGSATQPTWSTTQNIPFTFQFNGSPVQQYKVSSSGVLTFDINAANAPAYGAVALPNANIPDNSVCFLGLAGLGSNDFILTKVFGAAPNRQLWVFFTSYSLGTTVSDGTNYYYGSIVLEETTNKIYVVDQRKGGYTAFGGFSIGIQIDANTAITLADSPTTPSAALTNPLPADNKYYEFIQGTRPTNDLSAASTTIPKFLLVGNAPFNISADFKSYGSATATSVVLSYSVNGGAPVVSNPVTASINTFGNQVLTHTTPWNPTTGTYNLEIWASQINGQNDGETSNDRLLIQVNVVDTFITRKTLIENFSASTCGPCAPANSNFKNNILPNISNHTTIKYQQNFPGAGDPYQTTESVNRRGYYGINSIPRMELDGQWDGNGNSLTTAIYNSYQTIPSFLDIKIQRAEFSGDNVLINATIRPLVSYPNSTYKYHVVITEGKTTQNVGTNGETEFFDVMMKMIPNELGTAINTLTKNQVISINRTQNMVATNVEEMEDLSVVIFVQDDANKTVLQSETKKITPAVNIAELDKDGEGLFAPYPNPTSNQINIPYQLSTAQNIQIEILDNFGKLISSETISSNNGRNIHPLNVNNLNNGLYIIQVKTDAKIFVKKFVVSK